ncbi:ATP-binding cassette domain-containing protein [Bosea thiooxidans]
MSSAPKVHYLDKAFGGIKACERRFFLGERGRRPRQHIIGPNGGGKSTLFNCILGLQLEPTQGAVKLDWGGNHQMAPCPRLTGRRQPHLPAAAGLPGTLGAREPDPRWPGHSGLDARPTVRRARCGAFGKGRADDRLLQARPSDLRHARGPSYGQQKLLDAAMAFMAGPRLVLLDEPAGGVNLTMLGDLKERLRAINAEQGDLRGDRAQHGFRDVAWHLV